MLIVDANRWMYAKINYRETFSQIDRQTNANGQVKTENFLCSFNNGFVAGNELNGKKQT